MGYSLEAINTKNGYMIYNQSFDSLKACKEYRKQIKQEFIIKKLINQSTKIHIIAYDEKTDRDYIIQG